MCACRRYLPAVLRKNPIRTGLTSLRDGIRARRHPTGLLRLRTPSNGSSWPLGATLALKRFQAPESGLSPRGTSVPGRGARHRVQPRHAAPKLLECSRRTASSRTLTASTGASVSNRWPCERSAMRPAISRASAVASARPSASSSPSCDTVSCVTLRPRRTERTSRQRRAPCRLCAAWCVADT
jgi:hypothetical protein